MAAVGKSILRREFLRRRRLLSQEALARRSSQIVDRVTHFLSAKKDLKTFHSFLPIERNREVDTWLLVKRLRAMNKEVLISSTDFEAEKMWHFHYEEHLTFEYDRLGIPTPLNAHPASLSATQCIFIPLVIADKQGGRIGYGGGYYDRLLEGAGDVLKVGLSLGPCLDRIPSLEPHDVRLDYCITPTETIDCKHG